MSGSGAVRVSGVASVVITGVVIGFSMVGGHPTSGPGATHDVSMAEPDDETTATSFSRRAPAGASQLGQTRHGTNSDTALLQVRKVFAPADRSAPAGHEWYGIRARTCMHPDARASGGVPWSEWVVVTDAGMSYAGRRVPWTDFPPQQYSTDGIGRGKCNVGWVLVAVPRGSFRDVVTVSFRPHSPENHQWAV